MKKFTVLILSALLCLTAVFAAGCESGTSIPKNTFNYENGKLSFSLEKKVFSLSIDDLTVDTSKNAASSYINRIEEKEDIEDFFEILFTGFENGFTFAEIAKEDSFDIASQCAILTIVSSNKTYDFFLDKDAKKIYYIGEGPYYCADTGDFSAL
ncbi:MAG: hypothetical protein J6126_02035, partial [Clostridia bacterium]|nr:hypothetical protein [Clostridia bacterium]